VATPGARGFVSALPPEGHVHGKIGAGSHHIRLEGFDWAKMCGTCDFEVFGAIVAFTELFHVEELDRFGRAGSPQVTRKGFTNMKRLLGNTVKRLGHHIAPLEP